MDSTKDEIGNDEVVLAGIIPELVIFSEDGSGCALAIQV